jgi:hypothetical protein
MSIKKIKAAFELLSTCQTWSIQLLRINNSKRNGTSYIGREITLWPEGALSEFVAEIRQRYTSDEKNGISSFQDIVEYDGSTIDHVIYKIAKSEPLISSEYESLMKALASPDTEINPLELKSQAYVLRGIIEIDGEEKAIKLVSMQNPVTSLKHKFLKSGGTFKEISDKVLTLRTSIDVVIFDDTIYMLTLAGENLFNMERAYKAVCTDKLQVIKDCNIVTDFEAFSSIASSGHNPRKFVSFNDTHLQKLKNANSRKRIAKKFRITMDGDKFDSSKPDTADKLVKLLCDRGMVDPFDDNPMEVAGSKKWEF